MTALLTVDQLAARLSRAFADGELAQAEALIDDASAIACSIGRTDFAAGVPAVVVAVVAQMVRRALDNPGELSGEQMGSYSWQGQQSGSSGGGGGVYATRAETRLIRRAAGVSGMTAATLDTGLGDPYESGEVLL